MADGLKLTWRSRDAGLSWEADTGMGNTLQVRADVDGYWWGEYGSSPVGKSNSEWNAKFIAEQYFTAELKTRPGDQPIPIRNNSECVQDQVVRYIQRRKEVGIRRYGTALQPHNGRDALRDAFEEAIDLAQYLGQMIIERDGKLPGD
jgi:hypothetical protein